MMTAEEAWELSAINVAALEIRPGLLIRWRHGRSPEVMEHGARRSRVDVVGHASLELLRDSERWTPVDSIFDRADIHPLEKLAHLDPV